MARRNSFWRITGRKRKGYGVMGELLQWWRKSMQNEWLGRSPTTRHKGGFRVRTTRRRRSR